MWKLRVQFEFSMEKLPIAYGLGILSIIKEMIYHGSKYYYERLFVEGKRELKPFTYATYIQNLQIKNDTIYGERLILTISSHSYEFMMYLMNGSKQGTTYKYKNINLELKSKRLLHHPPQFTNHIIFKTLSPIIIENKERQPILAKDPSFEREFNYYANLLAQTFYHRELNSPLKILHTKMEKSVIKENVHQKQDDYIYFTGNKGLIQLKGDIDDLKMLYENGIGLRRSLGFGLLDVEGVTYEDE